MRARPSRDERIRGSAIWDKGGRTTWTIDLSFSVCTVRMLKSWQLFVHTTNWLRAAGTTTSLSSEYTNAIIKNQIMMSVSSPAIYVSRCRKWAYEQAWWRSQLVSSSRMMHVMRSHSRRTAQCSRTGSSLMMWWHSPTLNLPRDSVSHKEMGPIVLATRKWGWQMTIMKN